MNSHYHLLTLKFNFQITSGFLIGSSVVLAATAMYNQPGPKDSGSTVVREKEAQVLGSPVSRDDPILGEKPAMRPSLSFTSSTQSLVSFFSSKSGRTDSYSEMFSLAGSRSNLHTPLGASPYSSRSPSPPISETSAPIYTHKHRQWSQ